MILVCPVSDRDAIPVSCAHIMPHIALTPGEVLEVSVDFYVLPRAHKDDVQYCREKMLNNGGESTDPSRNSWLTSNDSE